jgi:hypothetical protein
MARRSLDHLEVTFVKGVERTWKQCGGQGSTSSIRRLGAIDTVTSVVP